MSLTWSPLSHPDDRPEFRNLMRCHYTEKKSSGSSYISTFSALIFHGPLKKTQLFNQSQLANKFYYIIPVYQYQEIGPYITTVWKKKSDKNTSPHAQLGRALVLKTRCYGFDSQADQPKNY